MINFESPWSIKSFLEERKRKKGGQTRTRREGEKKEGGKINGPFFYLATSKCKKVHF